MSVQYRTFGELCFLLTKQFPGVDIDLVRLYVNERYRKVLRHLQWTDLKLQSVLQTAAPYETGTVLVTNASTAVTLTGGTWTSAMSGRGFRIPGQSEYYQFTFATATTGTLDRAFEGDTAAAAAYRIFQNIYPLPVDVRTLLTMRVLGCPRDMDQMGQEQLDRFAADRSTMGTPNKYALHMLDLSTPPRKQVEVYPVPSEVIPIPFWYVQDADLFDAADTSVQIPVWFNPLTLIYGVEADITRAVPAFQNLNASLAAEGKFQEELGDMRAHEASVRPSFVPKLPSRYTRHRRARWQR